MSASKSQSHDLFDERKAAQAAAWLLLRAGGFLPRLKLAHLLYLAERRSLESHAVTLSGDLLVSTRDGPALARIRNLVNGANLAINGVWARLIVNSFDQMLALRNPDELESPETQLLALSDSDAEILDQVWARFGQFDQRQLVEYTRTHCPEWRDPGDSIIAIEMRDLFLAFGMDGETATAAAEIQEERKAMAPFKWRRQRADLRAFDAIMRRKGGEAPRTGDEIIRADGAPPWR